MFRCVVTIIISLYTFGVCSVFASVPKGVNLANLANWDIVIAQKASPSDVYAAEELQSHFARASDIHLPITSRSDQAAGGQRHIFIGSSSAMRASEVGFGTDGFGEEDFRIIVRDDNIAIAGHPQAGPGP